jgi:hypothetical protein
MATIALLLAGCADFEPFDPPVAGEMNPGPGLFSGPDGVFVLSRGEAPEAADPDDEGSAEDPRTLTRPPPE